MGDGYRTSVTLDKGKRWANLQKHGIDLALCGAIFDSPLITDEDARDEYGEVRWRSLGLLRGRVVVLVWTERDGDLRLISCRYGVRHEAEFYWKAVHA